MLRWIAYIKSLNPVLKHITSKMNPVADMLSRARYFDEEKMMAHRENEDFTDGVMCWPQTQKMWLMKYCHSKMSFMEGD